MSSDARWLPLDKPSGFTSHDLVAQARRRLGLKRIGHTGTLDPAATGVLVLALGKATRLIQYLPGDKAYRALIRLGVETDSYDAEGTVLREAPVPALSPAELGALLREFEGEQMQIPPMVSAISIGGQRLYQLARQGIEVERPARPVHFAEIRLIAWQSPLLEIDVTCSAGTYIRSLAHDLGERIGCGASLAGLRRTLAHGFAIAQCGDPAELVPLRQNPAQGLGADWPLQHLAAMQIETESELKRLRQGQPLEPTLASISDGELVRIYAPAGEFAALGQLQGTALRPRLLMLEPILEKAQPAENA